MIGRLRRGTPLLVLPGRVLSGPAALSLLAAVLPISAAAAAFQGAHLGAGANLLAAILLAGSWLRLFWAVSRPSRKRKGRRHGRPSREAVHERPGPRSPAGGGLAEAATRAAARTPEQTENATEGEHR